MYMGMGTADDIPLSVLFPQSSAAGLESLRRAARGVGGTQAGAFAKGWDWWPAYSVFAGPQSETWVILILCAVQPSGDGDWLEFQLQVGWTELGQHEVSASVNVACMCEADHGTHDVGVLTFVVGDEISLPQAFEACAERMTVQLTDSRDADFWRAREDLPTRRM
ncbi:hypothetical protein KNE206_54000 [Kitasatospora sp. NE20-6]|uniref:hypothetical protein n=1 Tax=Kitasatospora sp. NE20-6 TaxID=2859066 RepID=UPI0034DBF22F